MNDFLSDIDHAKSTLASAGYTIEGFNAHLRPDDIQKAINLLFLADYHIDGPGTARKATVDSDTLIGIPNDSHLGEGSLNFFARIRQMWVIHLGKNAGYSGFDETDSFANFRECEDFGVSAFTGCLVRMGDKWNRIKSLRKDMMNEQVGESMVDTLMDLANYAIIAICLNEEERCKAEKKAEWDLPDEQSKQPMLHGSKILKAMHESY